jgi:hypothetical protein
LAIPFWRFWPAALNTAPTEARSRRGYGRATLDLVVDYLATRPGCDRFFSSFIPSDGSPLGFYLQYGSVPTGTTFDDEPSSSCSSHVAIHDSARC